MNAHILERQFAKIGARARLRGFAGSVAINIVRDRDGEYFDIAAGRTAAAALSVVDTQPRLRHLVLMSRDLLGKHKFLCGHDERHWFVAAVPEQASVSTVATAMEALKPFDVRRLQQRLAVKPRTRNRRRNKAFVRQGEWFFVPIGTGFRPNEKLILSNNDSR